MSMESAKAFLERMKGDEEFARQVSHQKDQEARRKFVLGEGFSFTLEELHQVAGQLSEEDLEAVAAGYHMYPACCPEDQSLVFL